MFGQEFLKHFPTLSFMGTKKEQLPRQLLFFHSLMRRKGLEPLRPKAVTGSLILRVCQFRHPRVNII